MNESQNPIGRHVIADFWGAKGISNPDFLGQRMVAAAKEAGATVLGTHMHHFGEGLGVTGVVILAESHISVHTWPEFSFAAFDIFVCGSARPNVAIQVLQDELQPSHMDLKELSRGSKKVSMRESA
ncbi:MAG: adenosylmethionine decarboxylase [Pseudomonadota bacterium]